MTGQRIKGYGLNTGGRTLSFSFDGRTYAGCEGDTLAAALLAQGVQIVGRSFKYHRPRGFWGAWSDDPNGIFDIRLGTRHIPNCQASTIFLEEGMQARSVNSFPSAQFDLKAGLDLFNRFMPAGFYYKTFMWPDWHLFEPMIRKMAGLGRVNTDAMVDDYRSAQKFARCDLLVVGGGVAGLAAAHAAAEAGQDVVLIDDQPILGGGAYAMGQSVDDQSPIDWVTAQVHAIEAAGGRILRSTTALGVHDHNLVSLSQNQGFDMAPTLWRLRCTRIILATGAIERPLLFANNDLPGITSVSAAAEYLARYGVLVGQDIALLANNAQAEGFAQMFENAGARVQLLDGTTGAVAAKGRKAINAVTVGGVKVTCDTLLVSGGVTPTVHLWRHAGGKLAWDAEINAFVPAQGPKTIQVVGGAGGIFDMELAIDQAATAALGKSTKTHHISIGLKSGWPDTRLSKGRKWVDLQSDVTVKDVEMAASEGFKSVEHLKRYTTLGMSTDQGKTSNMVGLETLSSVLGQKVPEVGTTTFRPPFVPVPIELFSGSRRGTLVAPLKRLVLEDTHRALGAALGEYGGWLRPGWYGKGDPKEITQTEALTARNSAGIFDGSPLGKIEVLGPDAAAFLDFIYYNTISTLKVGAIRYGFMLHENGTVLDDGVVARLADDRFVISCSSSHVDAVVLWLENWRQDRFDHTRLIIHDTTPKWATVTITGPRAGEIIAKLGLGIEPASDDFPHMTFKIGAYRGKEARVSRVSFTGDLSFEISVPNYVAGPLWQSACNIGGTLGAAPIGTEAMAILRAEKGFIIVGRETEAETMPHDLGFAVPRQKKSKEFIGDRALHTEFANRDDRKQLVGLDVETGQDSLPVGAHLFEMAEGKRVSTGFVTSSYYSPFLKRPIALGLVNAGQARIGDTVQVWYLGKSHQAKLVPAVFLDPKGERLNAR